MLSSGGGGACSTECKRRAQRGRVVCVCSLAPAMIGLYALRRLGPCLGRRGTLWKERKVHIRSDIDINAQILVFIYFSRPNTGLHVNPPSLRSEIALEILHPRERSHSQGKILRGTGGEPHGRARPELTRRGVWRCPWLAMAAAIVSQLLGGAAVEAAEQLGVEGSPSLTPSIPRSPNSSIADTVLAAASYEPVVWSRRTGNSRGNSDVGICVTGMLRNFDDPCTLRTLIERMALPLRADVYTVVSIDTRTSKSIERERSRIAMLHRMLTRALGRQLVYFRGIEAFPLQSRRPNCTVDKVLGPLWYQSRSLRCCADQALHRGYTWMVRTRMDLNIPWFVESLPTTLSYRAPAGVVFVAISGMSLHWCSGCNEGGDNAALPCEPSSRCARIGDGFALVYGAAAQHAYFVGVHSDFADCARPRALDTKKSEMRGAFPEDKLAWSIGTRGVLVRDLRFAVRSDAMWEGAGVQIVRTSEQGCGGLESQQVKPLRVLQPSAVRSIPAGAWSVPRRRAACVEPISKRHHAYREQCRDQVAPGGYHSVPPPLANLLLRHTPEPFERRGYSLRAHRPTLKPWSGITTFVKPDERKRDCSHHGPFTIGGGRQQVTIGLVRPKSSLRAEMWQQKPAGPWWCKVPNSNLDAPPPANLTGCDAMHSTLNGALAACLELGSRCHGVVEQPALECPTPAERQQTFRAHNARTLGGYDMGWYRAELDGSAGEDRWAAIAATYGTAVAS